MARAAPTSAPSSRRGMRILSTTSASRLSSSSAGPLPRRASRISATRPGAMAKAPAPSESSMSSRHRPSSQGCTGRAGAPGLMAKRVDAPPACCVAGFTPGAAAAPRALEAPLAKEEGAGARGVGWVSGMKLCTVGTFAALRTPGETVKGQNGGKMKKRPCCKNAGFQCVRKPAAGRQSRFRRIGGLDALCAIFPWQICSF